MAGPIALAMFGKLAAKAIADLSSQASSDGMSACGIRNACNVLSAGIGRAPRAACRRDIGHSGSPALRRPSRNVFINFASEMGARRRRVEIVKRDSRRSRCATASRASLNRPSSTNETA
jgi:hypothetical protein